MQAKYDINWLISESNKGSKLKYLNFWGHQKSNSGEITASCFSQWWPSIFIIDGTQYATAEHWMMAQKAQLFKDQDIYDRILVAPSPAQAKALGREVINFDEELWNEKRMEIVLKGNLAKFSQVQELTSFLINTKDRILVEASPVDRIWGVGLTADDEHIHNPNKWKGLNLLGFALMEVRDILMEKSK